MSKSAVLQEASEGEHVEQRDEFIAGLRELADWYEQHPDFPLPYDGVTVPFSIYEGTAGVPAKELLRLAVAEFGLLAREEHSGAMVSVIRRFRGVSLAATVYHDETCEPPPDSGERPFHVRDGWTCNSAFAALEEET